MKPEIRIALVRELEKSKTILTNEYSGRWVRLGYVGALLSTVVGIAFLTTAIAFIAGHHISQLDRILGALQIVLALIFMCGPWYLLVRYWINRKMQLLSEAILAVGQFDGFISG